jgi:hypothetical protein
MYHEKSGKPGAQDPLTMPFYRKLPPFNETLLRNVKMHFIFYFIICFQQSLLSEVEQIVVNRCNKRVPMYLGTNMSQKDVNTYTYFL